MLERIRSERSRRLAFYGNSGPTWAGILPANVLVRELVRALRAELA